jgi:hypothetical protein
LLRRAVIAAAEERRDDKRRRDNEMSMKANHGDPDNEGAATDLSREDYSAATLGAKPGEIVTLLLTGPRASCNR